MHMVENFSYWLFEKELITFLLIVYVKKDLSTTFQYFLLNGYSYILFLNRHCVPRENTILNHKFTLHSIYSSQYLLYKTLNKWHNLLPVNFSPLKKFVSILSFVLWISIFTTHIQLPTVNVILLPLISLAASFINKSYQKYKIKLLRCLNLLI